MNSQKELLELQTNAEKVNNSESGKLIERIEVKGTPLIVVGSAESGYIVTLGKYQVTRRFLNKEDAIEAVNSRDYELLMSIISVCTTDIINQMEAERAESLLMGVDTKFQTEKEKRPDEAEELYKPIETEKGIEYKNSENPLGKL